MMLGDLLASARRSAAGVEHWLGAADPALAARLAAAALREGVSPAEYVRIAVADFTRFASEDDWATLVSRMRDDAEPGTACLLAMLEWRLAASLGPPSRPATQGAAS